MIDSPWTLKFLVSKCFHVVIDQLFALSTFLNLVSPSKTLKPSVTHVFVQLTSDGCWSTSNNKDLAVALPVKLNTFHGLNLHNSGEKVRFLGFGGLGSRREVQKRVQHKKLSLWQRGNTEKPRIWVFMENRSLFEVDKTRFSTFLKKWTPRVFTG